MGDVSKSAGGTTHGNAVVLQKVKICFQVYPGTAGTDQQRGIAGVPYSVEIGPKGNFTITTTDKTAKDGGIELNIPAGEIAVLTIFDTEYEISAKRSMSGVEVTKGVKERLSWLGYYLGATSSIGVDKEITLALLNFQADSNFNADGKFHEDALGNVFVDTNTQKQLKKDFGG